MLTFDQVSIYGPTGVDAPRIAVELDAAAPPTVEADLAIVTYGNGVRFYLFSFDRMTEYSTVLLLF